MNNPKLEIDIAHGELEDMLFNDKEFNWTFKTNTGVDIDIHVYKTPNEEEEDPHIPLTDEEETFMRGALLGKKVIE